MLDPINGNASNALSPGNRYGSDQPTSKGLTATQASATQASAVSGYSEDAVTLSLSNGAITASISHTSLVTAFTSDGHGNISAKAEYRQELESFKAPLKDLNLSGTDPAELIKNALELAGKVVGAARGYADAGTDAGTAGLAASSLAADSKAQALKSFADLKTKAQAAPPWSGGGDTPAGAPANPDDRFFYDSLRVLDQVKKVIAQARQAQEVLRQITPRTASSPAAASGSGHVQPHGHGHGPKTPESEIDDLEAALSDAYVDMKAGAGGGGDDSATMVVATSSTTVNASINTVV